MNRPEAVYRMGLRTARIVAGTLRWRVQVEGADQIPANGPAILAGNHVSYLDPLVMALVAQRRGRYVRFLAKRELFRTPVAGTLLTAMCHVPVHRGPDARRSVAAARALLDGGEILGVYPEGTISTSFVPVTLRTGAAQLAMLSGAPLIPVAVYGPQRITTKGRPHRLARGTVLAAFVGTPLAIDAGPDAATVTELLAKRLRGMVDALAAAYPHQPLDPSDAWWVPRHLGGTAPSIDEAEVLRAREGRYRR